MTRMTTGHVRPICNETKRDSLSVATLLGDSSLLKEALKDLRFARDVEPALALAHEMKNDSFIRVLRVLSRLLSGEAISLDDRAAFHSLKSSMSGAEVKALPGFLQRINQRYITGEFEHESKMLGGRQPTDIRFFEYQRNQRIFNLNSLLGTPTDHARFVRQGLRNLSLPEYHQFFAETACAEGKEDLFNFLSLFKSNIGETVESLLKNEKYTLLFTFMGKINRRTPKFTLIDQYLYQLFIKNEVLDKRDFTILCVIEKQTVLSEAEKITKKLFREGELSFIDYERFGDSAQKLVGDDRLFEFERVLGMKAINFSNRILKSDRLLPDQEIPAAIEAIILQYLNSVDDALIIDKYPKHQSKHLAARYNHQQRLEFEKIQRAISAIRVRLSRRTAVFVDVTYILCGLSSLALFATGFLGISVLMNQSIGQDIRQYLENDCSTQNLTLTSTGCTISSSTDDKICIRRCHGFQGGEHMTGTLLAVFLVMLEISGPLVFFFGALSYYFYRHQNGIKRSQKVSSLPEPIREQLDDLDGFDFMREALREREVSQLTIGEALNTLEAREHSLQGFFFSTSVGDGEEKITTPASDEATTVNTPLLSINIENDPSDALASHGLS